jgi:trehalose-6-phosphatase
MTPEIDVSWKKDVLEIFDYYTDRTPGSYIEQKETSLVWHFGLADQSFGAWQAAECLNHIQNALAASYSIHPLAKKKSVEVMPRNVNKGIAVRRILHHHQGRRHSSHYVSTPHGGHSHGRRASIQRGDSVEYGDDSSQPTSPESYYISPQPRSISPVHHGSSRRGVIDFILCIGDDRQDEAMFEYLTREDMHARTQSGISDASGIDPVSPCGVSDEESLQMNGLSSFEKE